MLVGGGVCIDLAELIELPASFSDVVFKGGIAELLTSTRRRLFPVAKVRFGEDDSLRDDSTGGRGRLGLGDG